MPQRIVIIEDEPAIADTITYALKTDGFEPVWCETGAEGLEAIAAAETALVVLDVGLPDTNGFELCKQLRKTSAVPVMFLTARAGEIDRVVGLEIGADDYMVKPFSPRELAARVKAILRRTASMPVVSDADAADTEPDARFTIDEHRKVIAYHGTDMDLSRYEYGLLRILVSHPGRVFSRRELMEQVWDEPEVSLERTVDTHIKTIRTKLHTITPNEDPIETRRGFGYALGAED